VLLKIVCTKRLAMLLGLLLSELACASFSSSQEPAKDSIAMSITPSSGSGNHQSFTGLYSHAGGAAQFATVRVLFNRDADGRAGCYVYYDRASSSFLLVNDSGEGTTRLPVGNPSHLANAQCDLDGSASSVSENGNQLKVSVALQFKPAFKGKLKIYLFGDTVTGHGTGLKEMGTWDLP
jgi:hypothetical protein